MYIYTFFFFTSFCCYNVEIAAFKNIDTSLVITRTFEKNIFYSIFFFNKHQFVIHPELQVGIIANIPISRLNNIVDELKYVH